MSQRSESIGALGRDHVLFFFFRSDCPYCHAFAPTLEAFQARHGIRVVAISVDGGSMPGFPDARRDNGIATTLKVTQVPAVYLAQPFTGKITPIGFGVLSEAQLVERITIVAAAPRSRPRPYSRGNPGRPDAQAGAPS
jgi:conjugal transfer pilus assembly protein TraF